MTDEPRWPRGTPVAEGGRGPGGGRWMGSVVSQMARGIVASMTDHALHLRAQHAVDTARGLPDTRELHRPGGPDAPWAPERAAMHDRILRRVYDRYADIPAERKAVIAGGLPGAGKTSVLSGQGLLHYMPVNPDDMKDELIAEHAVPEHPELSPMELNPAFHIESAYLADRLLEMALANGRNVVIDATMGNPEAPRARLRRLADAGYRVRGVFVDVPVETSQTRVAARYLEGMRAWARGQGHGGRPIPADIIERSRGEGGRTVNRQVFEQLASEGAFDAGWEIFDNSGAEPRLVESGEGSDYRGLHQPPDPRDGHVMRIDNLEDEMPGVYEHPDWYLSRETDGYREAVRVMRAARNNPGAMITIYRGVPTEAAGINPGDWVTISRAYALAHGRHPDDPNQDWPVVSMQVPARDVYWGGNDFIEFGYWPGAS